MRKFNWTYLIVKLIVKLYMIGAISVSFTHIVEVFAQLGLQGWQGDSTPFAIDGFAILGMIGRSEKFAASTRRIGFRVQMVAGSLSLIANIFAGHNLGERIYGVIIVGGFVFAEWYGDKLRPVQADVKVIEQVQADAKSAVRSEAAKKAAITRAANAAENARKAAERAEARKLTRLNREAEKLSNGQITSIAPVSPAPEPGYL
jgi:hypothetical protein